MSSKWWGRRLLKSLGLVRLVVLHDSDGEENLRVWRNPARPEHVGSARRLGFGIRTVGLRRDGTCANGSYVKSWREYEFGDTLRDLRERESKQPMEL